MIPSERPHLHVTAITHPGMSGKNNEDNYAVSAHRLSESNPIPSVLAVLADGVGGHQAGEVASEIAIETISKIVLNSDASTPLEILEYAFDQANQKVAGQSDANDDRQGMGSTCSCVWIIDDLAYTASVGDSRIYFIRDGSIRQITTDHTWVQEAIEHGILTPEQARNHPRAHVIRRFLGSKNPIEPDFRLRLNPGETDEQALANQGMKLLPGDQFLICSDGLTDLVDETEILERLQKEEMDQALQSLVDTANQRGGHDNITIVVLKVPQFKEEVKHIGKTRGRTRMKWSWYIFLAVGIFIILAAALTTVLYLYMSRTTSGSGLEQTATIQAPLEATLPEIFPGGITETIQPVQEITLEATQDAQTDLTPTIQVTETPLQDTYTPWPTHTWTPEP